jgi:hypothetical protein
MKYQIGDMVHARHTVGWYGFITNIVGKNIYVHWFDRQEERDGWYPADFSILEKIS